MKVGLHQGSAISPLLFIIINDVIASEIDTEPHWAMLFTDDLVRCERSKAAIEGEPEMWRPIRKTWADSQLDKNRVHAL